MDNKQKLDQIFITNLGVTADELNDDLNVLTADNWDSVMQLTLVSELEDTFDVMFDSDDVVELTSYTAAKEILSRMGVEL